MIKLYEQFVNEMAQITKIGKKILADDTPLKELDFTQISDNIVFYKEEQGNWFWPKGKFFLYFTDSKETAEKICKGEYDFLSFPVRNRYNAFTVSPIVDIWKRKHTNRYKGADHIIGIIEGWTDDKKILIEMMSVRKDYKHNKINTFMLDNLKTKLKTDKFIWEDPTDEGYAFLLNYDSHPEFKWNTSNRPKNFHK